MDGALPEVLCGTLRHNARTEEFSSSSMQVQHVRLGYSTGVYAEKASMHAARKHL